jgi:galactokinase
MISLSMTTKAVLATIEENHTIKVPLDMPVGRKVAVFLIPEETPGETADSEDEARSARFAAALELINEAAKKPQKEISKEELHALIDEARKARES